MFYFTVDNFITGRICYILQFIGCGIFAVGIWMQVNRGPYMNLLPSHYVFGATAIICITGVVALIIGFCGFCGGIMESRLCMIVVSYL